MISKILEWVAKKTYGKKALDLLDKANAGLSGHRSEILLGLLALIYVLERVGVVPDGTFEASKPFLYGALPVTMAEKVKGVIAKTDKFLPKR